MNHMFTRALPIIRAPDVWSCASNRTARVTEDGIEVLPAFVFTAELGRLMAGRAS
jgi:hypothetical protein